MTELLTLNAIRARSIDESAWNKLLAHLGKTKADDAPLSMLTVLDSNGLEGTLRCLRCINGRDGAIRLLACDFAQEVAHLNPDPRVQAAIDVARRYAVGNATVRELRAAYDAAYDAARAAAANAAEAAAHAAAYATADAAWAAAEAAALAAEAAADHAAWDARAAAADAADAAEAAAYAEAVEVAAYAEAVEAAAYAAQTAILRRWIIQQEAA